METGESETPGRRPTLEGRRIKELRLARNWSQYDFAAEAGLKRAWVGGMETGKIRDAGGKRMAKAAAAFGFPDAAAMMATNGSATPEPEPEPLDKRPGDVAITPTTTTPVGGLTVCRWYPVTWNGTPQLPAGGTEGGMPVPRVPVPELLAATLGEHGKGVLLEDDELDRWHLHGARLRGGTAVFTNPALGDKSTPDRWHRWEGRLVIARDTLGNDRAGVLRRSAGQAGWFLTTASTRRTHQLSYPCEAIYGPVLWTQPPGGSAIEEDDAVPALGDGDDGDEAAAG